VKQAEHHGSGKKRSQDRAASAAPSESSLTIGAFEDDEFMVYLLTFVLIKYPKSPGQDLRHRAPRAVRGLSRKAFLH
jgi:hypothetical protein